MTPSALPDNWQELLAGYVLGDLDADEQRLVQQWIDHDPAVARELAALEETWHALPQTLPLHP
ncbi:anti-sigma factor, partial [filamentous cyanobacterium CCP5]